MALKKDDSIVYRNNCGDEISCKTKRSNGEGPANQLSFKMSKIGGNGKREKMIPLLLYSEPVSYIEMLIKLKMVYIQFSF